MCAEMWRTKYGGTGYSIYGYPVPGTVKAKMLQSTRNSSQTEYVCHFVSRTFFTNRAIALVIF